MISVSVECTCPTCKGLRFVEHPGWTEFIAHFKKENLELTDLENGYAETWFYNHGYLIPPARKLSCPNCKATGLISSSIPIEQFSRMIQQKENTQCQIH